MHRNIISKDSRGWRND